MQNITVIMSHWGVYFFFWKIVLWLKIWSLGCSVLALGWTGHRPFFFATNECRSYPQGEKETPNGVLNRPVKRDNKSCPGFPLPAGASFGCSVHS